MYLVENLLYILSHSDSEFNSIFGVLLNGKVRVKLQILEELTTRKKKFNIGIYTC